MAHKQYWDQDKMYTSIDLETRATIALRLIETYGSVAGKAGQEDSSGRSRLELQTPEELVERCFRIADLFVETAESRGEIREPAAWEERHAHIGKARRIQMDAEFSREKVNT